MITGKSELDYGLRHDWNSLLPEPSHSSASAAGAVFDNRAVPCLSYDLEKRALLVHANATCHAADFSSSDRRFHTSGVAKGLLFRDYSRTYYPEADKLHEYFTHFASASAARGVVTGGHHTQPGAGDHGLNVHYRTTVTSVARAAEYGVTAVRGLLGIAEGGARFRLTTKSSDGKAKNYTCTFLIWAGGLQAIVPPLGEGIAELAENYATASTNLDDYDDKAVLILGRGYAHLVRFDVCACV